MKVYTCFRWLLLQLYYKSWVLSLECFLNLHCQVSNLGYPNADYPKLLGYSKTMTVPTLFSIIYCNKTTNYSNFDHPKNSIFRSDSSVPIEEVAIKLPFKIRSPKVMHGDHDFFVWSSSIAHLGDLANKVATGNWHRINLHPITWWTVNEKWCLLSRSSAIGFVWCF